MCSPAFLCVVFVNHASNMIRIRLNNCIIFWKQREFLHGLDNLQKLVCKSCGANTQVHLQFFLQTKTLDEIERQICYANGFSNCSSTSSKILFHGLSTKCKRPSIRKQIVVIITVNSLLVYCFYSHLQRDILANIFWPVFSWTFRKFLQGIKKTFRNFLENSQESTRGEVLF